MKLTIVKGWKYEIFPNDEQQQLIDKTIGCCRWVWNWALKLKIDNPEMKWGEISKALMAKKREPEFKWLNEVNSQALVHELRHLQDAFKRYFDS